MVITQKDMLYGSANLKNMTINDMKGLLKAAKKGNILAQSQLGNMYYRGVGVDQDFHEAVLWYEKAGNRGDASSQFRLGMMYANGIGVEQNVSEAVDLLKKAALQGHSGARLYLGTIYEIGLGVPKDYDEAMRWFNQGGDVDSENDLDDPLYTFRAFRNLAR